MKYHVLNGDVLAEKFPVGEIAGNLIVIREAFIEGPLSIELNEAYWERRAAFVATAYGAELTDYQEQFMSQLEILDAISNEDEVCLWFEDDLFCVTNMWFTIYYLSLRCKPRMYRVFPEKDDNRWSGYGNAGEKELTEAYNNKEEIEQHDVELSNHLWEAYVTNDTEKLRALSFSDTTCFRFLPRVIQAHLERNPSDGSIGRPHRTLIDILNEGKTNFYEIFDEFWKKEAIYGFGDMQIYNILKEMEIDFSGDMN